MILPVNSLFGKNGEEIRFEKSFDLKEKDQFESVGVLSVESFSCDGVVRSYGDTLLLTMDYRASLNKLCDRCLGEYDEYIEGSLNRTITKDEDRGSFECVLLEGNNLDIHEIACDELMMILPSQSICDNDCMGICTECGANLNEEVCECN